MENRRGLHSVEQVSAAASYLASSIFGTVKHVVIIMDNTLQDIQNSPYDTKADSSNTVILVIANNYF